MIGERLCYYMIFSKSQRGKIQTEKKSAFQLAEERRKDSGFGPSDGWRFTHNVRTVQIIYLIPELFAVILGSLMANRNCSTTKSC